MPKKVSLRSQKNHRTSKELVAAGGFPSVTPRDESLGYTQDRSFGVALDK
jgi:hypothetical protein